MLHPTSGWIFTSLSQTRSISDAAPNVITIRARMSVEIAGRVSNELARVGQDNKTEINLGAHTGALLLHNILGWSGPDFDDLPCTPANIASLPQASSDPFIEKVVNAIGERNRKRDKPKRAIASYRQYIRECWRTRLDRTPGQRPTKPEPAIGDWELCIALAERYHWTPEQIGRLDPDFLEELGARFDAERDLERIRLLRS
jgi:hypothetical protein